MKFLLISVFTLWSFISFSQDSDETNISIETQFQLFNSSGESNNNLKIRYHFNDKHVLRTNWTFSFASIKNEILETDGDGVGTIESIGASHNISLGYERHFNYDKMSPYLGTSIGYGFGNDSEYGSRTDGSTFINDFNYSQEQKISSVSIDVFSGFDFNIYKGLYLGTEIGLRFVNSKIHRGELKTEDASSTTDATTITSIPEQKSSTLSLVNMGVVRVGWKF